MEINKEWLIKRFSVFSELNVEKNRSIIALILEKNWMIVKFGRKTVMHPSKEKHSWTKPAKQYDVTASKKTTQCKKNKCKVIESFGLRACVWNLLMFLRYGSILLCSLHKISSQFPSCVCKARHTLSLLCFVIWCTLIIGFGRRMRSIPFHSVLFATVQLFV